MAKRGNNEGSIVQRPSGAWRAQVTLDGRRLSFSGKTRKDCQEWIKKTVQQIDEGMRFASTQITLAEFLGDWLEAEKLDRRVHTVRQYSQISKDYILPALGKVRLKDLRAELIQKLYGQLIGRGISAYLINKVHSILSASLNQALRMGAIARNPAQMVRPPRLPEKEMNILDTSQINQLLITSSAHPLGALIHLAIVSGLRQMELLGLKWGDLDWVKQTLRVERQLDRPRGEGVKFVAPKTRAGLRTIYLDGYTIEVLREHYEQQGRDRLSCEEWVETGLIFTTGRGTPLHPRRLLRTFKGLLVDAGLPEIRFHDLRHTAASLLLNNGFSPMVVSRRLGHSRTSVTLDVYGHLHPSEEIEAVNQIGALITPVVMEVKGK